jgi:hypothetical protein
MTPPCSACMKASAPATEEAEAGADLAAAAADPMWDAGSLDVSLPPRL